MDGNIQAQTGGERDVTREPALDVSQMNDVTLSERLSGLLFNPRVLRAMRAVQPVLRTNGLVVLTRYDDVRALLEHDQVFEVEGERIRVANGGPDFLLGMQDDKRCPFERRPDAQHAPEALGFRDYQAAVMQHFPLQDLEGLRQLMSSHAQCIVDASCQLDASFDLITSTAVAVCRQYYGVDIVDEDDFVNCTFAISRWLFDPLPTSRFAALAARASLKLKRVIDASISRARRLPGDTVLGRLVQAGTPDEKVRAIISGMIWGFVPTSTMAATHILHVLLERPEALEAARSAACAHDDELLERCLFEALRFKPLLRQPLRRCVQPYTFAEGTRHASRVEPGDRIIGLMDSALMDERRVARPNEFDPSRPIHKSFLFGSGVHRCIGAPIATLHIVHSLKPLLLRRSLRAAPSSNGQQPMCGPFIKHMFVQV